MKTTKGSIFVELYPNKAPITVANFISYVDKGIYTNSSFFRVTTPVNEADRDIKIEVIQGGHNDESVDLAPIVLETTKQTGIKHLDGTISMARDKPNSATNSFFICIGDQLSLDFGGKRNPDGLGFAAFGKVTKGMDIVLAIQKEKDTSQYLVKPILIESIKRIN
ncbi:MAG: peptidylprolyl isomerase [Flavobacteriaceae bacterium]